MEHKIYMNYIHPSSLLRQLAVLWRSDQLCDAVITVDKIIVSKAHKLVLFAVSPKLSEESKSSSQSPILDVTLPAGVGHKAVHSFLQYIYEGYLILTQEVASDLLKIANYLEIRCLTNCCSDFIEYIQAKENRLIVPPSEIEFGKPKSEEFTHVRTSSVKGAPSNEKRPAAADNVPESSKRPKHQTSSKPEFRVSSPQVQNAKRKLPQNSPESKTTPAEGGAHFLVQEVNSGKKVMSDLDLDWKEKSQDIDTSIVKKENDIDRVHVDRVHVDRVHVDRVHVDQVHVDGGHVDGGQTSDDIFIQEHENLNRRTSQDPDTIEIDLSDVKEEMDDSDQSFMNQDQYSEDVPQMWFSPETGTVESLNQSDPVISMSNPMGASGFMQRTLTPSLKQLRAQQSIKRSIQSSMSAARRARNLAGSSPTMVPTPGLSGDVNNGSSELPEESPGGGGSQETLHGMYAKVEPGNGSPMTTFKCPDCSRTFHRLFNYQRHRNTHLTVKPYSCSVCDNQFSSKFTLERHLAVKHFMGQVTKYLPMPLLTSLQQDGMISPITTNYTKHSWHITGKSEKGDPEGEKSGAYDLDLDSYSSEKAGCYGVDLDSGTVHPALRMPKSADESVRKTVCSDIQTAPSSVSSKSLQNGCVDFTVDESVTELS